LDGSHFAAQPAGDKVETDRLLSTEERDRFILKPIPYGMPAIGKADDDGSGIVPLTDLCSWSLSTIRDK
jgi:hypothetical protein